MNKKSTLRSVANDYLTHPTETNGITLIALIVTIIVMLILAGISISTLAGENGIINRAILAKEKMEIAEVKELAKMDVSNYVIGVSAKGKDVKITPNDIKTIIQDANKNYDNKYYNELTDEGIITNNGYFVDYDEIGIEFEESNNVDDNNGSNHSDNPNAREVTVGSLGKVEVVAPDNTQFLYDENTGAVKAVPPEDEMPEDPEDIEGEENIEKPNLINFTIGEFENTEEEYITVQYNEITTKTKMPVEFVGRKISKWYYTEEEATALNAELVDIEQKYSNYIAYQSELEDAEMEFMGVESPSLIYFYIKNSEDDTEANAVYLAAFMQQIREKTYYVAKWDGSKYVKENLDSNIAAVTDFTEVVVTPKTKQVPVSRGSSATFVPTDSLTAVEGMNWNQWLVSDYNTTDFEYGSTWIYSSSGERSK